jgi:hypothetical protein
VFIALMCGRFNAPVVSWSNEICHPDGSREDNTLEKEWIFLEVCWKGFGKCLEALTGVVQDYSLWGWQAERMGL